MEFDKLSSRGIGRAIEVHRDEAQLLTHVKIAGAKIGVENFNATKLKDGIKRFSLS